MNVAVKEFAVDGGISKRIENLSKIHVGKICNTNTYGKIEILEVLSLTHVKVKFLESGHITDTWLSSTLTGKIKDISRSRVYGVGYLGGDQPKNIGSTKEYRVWKNMLERCYGENRLVKSPSYDGCSVSDEFLNFTFFKDWCNNQVGFGNEGYHFDKDLLVKGNKVYSPDTCCFIPVEINSLLTTTNKRRGDTPIGVCVRKKKKGYQACLCINGKDKHLGSFDCPIKAFESYKVAREAYYKEKAEQWKGKISDEAYEALKNRKVEITD